LWMQITITGLLVGIIAYFGYNFLVTRVDRVVYKLEDMSWLECSFTVCRKATLLISTYLSSSKQYRRHACPWYIPQTPPKEMAKCA